MIDTHNMNEHEITITRSFDAPRELVWTAFTTPAHLEQWFAPRPVIVKPGSVVIDPRPGGEFALTMVMPDGTEYPDHGSFGDFEPPSRLSFGGTIENHPGLTSASTVVTLADLGGGRTEVTVVHTMVSTDEMPEMARLGWGQGLDQLAELVASLQS